ncbi:MAG: dihydrodipicolinate synthase family protein [Thermodesulfobacteriota bacterium]
MKIDLTGIIPPIATPFDEKGNIDHGALARNVARLSQTGIRGVLVLGSNGEYPYLSEAEKREAVKTVVAATPDDMVVMVGSGCESTRETIHLTNDCAAMGAHAALVVTPCYYGGKMTPAALEDHFVQVADHADIPILLYNVPKFTNINIDLATILKLSGHPNIAGIKDSSGNVAQMGELLSRVDDGFQVLVGTAGALLAALTLGCPGGILALANVAPRECVQIMTLLNEGDIERARDLQLKMLPVNRAVTATFGIAGLKAAMDMLGYDGGEPRPPLLPLDETAREGMKQILKTAGLLDK